MGADPFSGAIYVFLAKRADRVKLIFWDGSGMVLVARRLEDGEFRWPKAQDGATAAHLWSGGGPAAHHHGAPDCEPATWH
uniref:IS66 family insertion sequence element accessory protein TnpB n=1 Tax=Magnetospirillum gryphiswaldense TaxID=55518 RepID=UPI003989553E